MNAQTIHSFPIEAPWLSAGVFAAVVVFKAFVWWLGGFKSFLRCLLPAFLGNVAGLLFIWVQHLYPLGSYVTLWEQLAWYFSAVVLGDWLGLSVFARKGRVVEGLVSSVIAVLLLFSLGLLTYIFWKFPV